MFFASRYIDKHVNEQKHQILRFKILHFNKPLSSSVRVHPIRVIRQCSFCKLNIRSGLPTLPLNRKKQEAAPLMYSPSMNSYNTSTRNILTKTLPPSFSNPQARNVQCLVCKRRVQLQSSPTRPKAFMFRKGSHDDKNSTVSIHSIFPSSFISSSCPLALRTFTIPLLVIFHTFGLLSSPT